MSGTKAFPEDLEAWILESLRIDDVPAPADRVKAGIMARVAALAAGDRRITTVLAAEAEWLELMPGVDVRILHDHGRVQTWLARGASGASFPSHDHPESEECLVLEGSVVIDGVLLHRGDYQIAPPGTRHGRIASADGCLLLMRSPCPAMKRSAAEPCVTGSP